MPHYPSKLVREGGIRNFFPNFGIEDRGDSGGVVSLVSKPEALEAQLRKYAESTSNQTVTNAVRRALIHKGAHPHTVPAGT